MEECISNAEFKLGKRHQRLLQELSSGPKTRKELNESVGALNLPHYVMELRRKGYKIETSWREVHDRDSHKCRIGVYTLRNDDQAFQESDSEADIEQSVRLLELERKFQASLSSAASAINKDELEELNTRLAEARIRELEFEASRNDEG